MKITDNAVYFYGNKDHFSNFYKCNFTVNGITFNCGEQFIMYSKALLFKDKITAERILLEESPSKIKALGRKVANYDDAVWCHLREDITYIGLLNKYQQNNKLKEKLIDTNTKELVEASPKDTIWGIGMSDDDPELENKSIWGKNILGKILMRVRDHIKSENTIHKIFS